MDLYTSQKLPPDVPSRRRFREICKTIPEAYKVAKVWHCPRDAWERTRPVSRRGEVLASKPADDALALEILRRNGLRLTREVRSRS